MALKVENSMKRYNFGNQSGALLVYWKYRALGNGWWTLTVKDQLFRSTDEHEALEGYRKCSLKFDLPIGPGRQVDQEWLAGLSAQTWMADQRTKLAPNQFIGQLVMPVFVNEGAHQLFLGVIELVTAEPKESYVEEFKQIQNLLKDENLATKPLAKMIKVSYLGDTIKFLLPISSGIPYLWERVTERFQRLRHTTFQIKYYNANGMLVPISGEHDLQACIASSGSPTIRMLIE